MQTKITKIFTLDCLVSYASIACSIECALAPFLVGTLPMMGLGMGIGETVELALMWVAIALSLTSLVPGFIDHLKILPLTLFATSVGLLCLAHLIFEDSTLHIPLVLAGAGLLVIANIINRNYRQRMNCTSSAGCLVHPVAGTDTD
jgi:hypothetical protein